MKNWKTKLFGDNSMNFYSWLVVGLLVIGASGYYMIRALDAERYLSSQTALLLAIYTMLLGHFGIAWHTYLARVAEKLDAAKKQDANGHAT